MRARATLTNFSTSPKHIQDGSTHISPSIPRRSRLKNCNTTYYVNDTTSTSRLASYLEVTMFRDLTAFTLLISSMAFVALVHIPLSSAQHVLCFLASCD